MSRLNDAALDKEPDSKRDLEEMYEKLFPKIGRDFVYRDDLYKIINIVMDIVDPLGLTPVDMLSSVEAHKKALVYKATLESGQDGNKLFRDLINLDED